MISFVCADSNLALKLVLVEPDSGLAKQLWRSWQEQGIAVIAPRLWAYETASVLRNRAHRGLLAVEDEPTALEALLQLPINFVEPGGLLEHSHALARRYNLATVYDAAYLALAEMAGCDFWTADERLYNAVGTFLPWVHLLRSKALPTS